MKYRPTCRNRQMQLNANDNVCTTLIRACFDFSQWYGFTFAEYFDSNMTFWEYVLILKKNKNNKQYRPLMTVSNHHGSMCTHSLKGPFHDSEMIFLWHCSEGRDKTSLFPNFQSIRRLCFRVMQFSLCCTYCIGHYVGFPNVRRHVDNDLFIKLIDSAIISPNK